VYLEHQVVGPIAQESQPAGIANDAIEGVAMDDEHAAAIRGHMDDFGFDHHATELEAYVVAQHLVVIAGDIDDLRPLPCLAEDLLDNVVVALSPVPGLLEPPAVDD